MEFELAGHVGEGKGKVVLVGADGGGRTHTLLRVLDFESSASANSATSATRKSNLHCFAGLKRRRSAVRKQGFVSFTTSVAQIITMLDARKTRIQTRIQDHAGWMWFDAAAEREARPSRRFRLGWAFHSDDFVNCGKFGIEAA